MTPDTAHILLAEDDPADVELALSAMQAGDPRRRIEVVNTGEDALDYLLRRRAWKGRGASQPALVLLDLKMPGIHKKRCPHAVHSGGGFHLLGRAAGCFSLL
jgi:CheY-like chemotaxis protein